VFGKSVRKQILGLAIGAFSSAMTTAAMGQAYPAKPVTFLDNITGGPPEVVKRAVFAKVKENTGATFILEGRLGGGGANGLQAVRNAAPDGYTFGITYQSALTLNPLVNPDIGIDPLNDFTPVSKSWVTGNIWLARTDHPAKDLRDLVAMAKAKPESVKIGVFGAGNRFFVAQLEEKTGAKFLQVPYKTTPDGMAAVLGGQIDASFDSPATALGQKGRLKIITYGADRRLTQAPDVPTSQELYGIETIAWVGLIAPPKISAEHVNWVAREFNRAMRDPAVAQIMNDQMLITVGNTPAEFASQIRTEVEHNRELVRRFPGIR